jgi:hypothetical protein
VSKYFKKVPGKKEFLETSTGEQRKVFVKDYVQEVQPGDRIEREVEGKKELRVVLEKIEEPNGAIVIVTTSEEGAYNGA